jgi:O-antigen/teichoic acid export membrane protein
MKSLPKLTESSRNVLILMTGTTLAQAVPIAVSPILTRLYSPQEFGVLALFLSVTTILAVVANGRYELAIMAPDDEADAMNIAAASVGIALGLSALTLILILMFNEQIAVALGSRDIAPWLYVAPLAMLLSGIYNVLNYLNTRLKQFGEVARANVAKSATVAVLQTSLGAFGAGASGLIVGQVAGIAAGSGRLATASLRSRDVREKVCWRRMRENLALYSHFPRYSLPAALSNSLSTSVVSVLMARFYSVPILGQYALVNRIMALPLTLIGNAMGQVFFQEASEERRQSGTAIHAFRRTLGKLTLISVPSFAIAFFIVEDLFVFAFGEPWRAAGQFAQILVPVFAIRFLVSPLSLVNQVMNRNRTGMYLNFALLLGSVATVSMSGLAGLPVHAMLIAFSAVMSSLYLLFLVVIYMQAGAPAAPAGE